MEHPQETGPSIYRRRRRRRAVFTLTFVTSLLVATLLYAATYVQGWVGSKAPPPVALAPCQPTAPRLIRPGDVTVNVYNTTPREGLAASVATSLRKQGFEVDTVGNDPLGLTIRGIGQIRHGSSGTAAASLTGRWLLGATVVQDERTDATVDFVLGHKFIAVSAPSKTKRSTLVKPTVCPAQ